MLTKKTPDTVKAVLKIKGQGEEHTLMLTYHNHTPEKYQEFVQNPDSTTWPDSIKNDVEGIAHINASIVLFVVKSFDDGTDEAFPLNRAGLMDLEAHWPRTLIGIVQGYHQARWSEVEKN